MASKHFFIWWDELDRKDMPRRCMNCGEKAQWYSCDLRTTNVSRSRREKRQTFVPLCDEHRGTGGMLNTGLVPLHANTDEGAWIDNPNEDFIEALKKHRKKEIEEWEEENEGADPEDFENRELPPGLRTPPERPTFAQQLAKNPVIFLFGGLLALVLLVFICGGCGMAGMVIFAMTRR